MRIHLQDFATLGGVTVKDQATVSKTNAHNQLPIALAALIAWSFALYFPLAKVEKLGIAKECHLLSIGSAFRTGDHLLLGLCVDLLAVVFPSLLFLLLPIAVAPAGSYLQQISLKFIGIAKTWAMPEVFCLSILIAFIKLEKLAEASISRGFYFLLASTFLMILLLPKLTIPEATHRKSRNSAVAYLLAAAALLIPANILPIMIVTTTQGSKSSTIVSGVSELASHGLWGIAAIVFTASILVPIGKLGGLAWLLLYSETPQNQRFNKRLYRTIDFVGRWSMLDIFLIAVLTRLIDFGTLASIRPGPAAPAFAAAVILTVIAVERFQYETPS